MRCRIRKSTCSPETNHPQSMLVRALLVLVTLTAPGNISEQHAAADEHIGSKPTLRVDTLPGIVTRDSWLCDFLSDKRAGVNCLTHTTLQNTSIQDGPPVEVPEPLLFDLVHPLGVRRNAVEFNTLAIMPWSASNATPDDDPFGSGTTTSDKGGIEWAPEVEYAIADNLAVEFEFPFESSTLEEYKLGLQWTIGTAFDDRYIHGFQTLFQPTTEWQEWNSTLLYLGGIEINDTWSALFMIGGRMDLEGPARSETFEELINVSVFAELSEAMRVGLETNFASQANATEDLIVVPQFQYQVANNFEIQSGLGFGTFSQGHENSFMLRVVVTN
ncbi:MAG: hypothetical protein JNL58_17545 [Planctomyces sp.]|nr:hypothetical protein [Planctomyces sp.]